jgi:hypothetical protein
MIACFLLIILSFVANARDFDAGPGDDLNFKTDKTTRLIIKDGGDVTIEGLDADRAMYLDSTKAVKSHTVSTSELGYLEGVTSGIQNQLDSKEPTISLTPSFALISNDLGLLDTSVTTATELGYLSGVLAPVQDQLDSKIGAITLFANKAVISDGAGALDTSVTTSTELSYLSGVTTYVQDQLNNKEDAISLAANFAVITNGSGALDVTLTTATELSYLSGATSNIQAQIDSIPGAPVLTANRALISNGSGAIDTTVTTDVELSYLSGVTSPIQAQIDAIGGGGGSYTVALVMDVKTAGTSGGSFTNGAWRTRDLNTLRADHAGIVTISANQFTLQPGTYFLTAVAMAFNVSTHKLKLRNITDSTDDAIGMVSEAQSNVNNPTRLDYKFTIGSVKTYELQHRCEVTVVSNGFGDQAGAVGEEELYTVIIIRKL